MEVKLLGPLEAVSDAGTSVEIRGVKLKALLALLALRPGEVVSSARIIEALWGDQAVRDPHNALQVVVSKLRRALATGGGASAPAIATADVGYRLDLGKESIDVVRFERLAHEGRRLLADGNARTAAEVLRDALGLWRGPALVDFLDYEFASGESARLEELRATSIEQRIEADLALGRHEQLTAELESLIAEHPLRERLRAHHMLSLYRSGRQVDALRAFQAARIMLAEEVGVEPGPELQRLEAAVLAQDAGLDPPTVTAGVRQRGNLPAPISGFIGRSEELKEIAALVRAHRLVTLVGPGGAGKTRLAIEAAELARASQTDGCWIVELAAITDPALVDAAAVSALGLDDARALEEFSASRQTLIVLDNCEHVVGAAAALAERLLRPGGDVKVLATSREALGLAGERRWAVPPLAPDDAHALFVDRAAAGGSATHGAGQATMVDQICGRLDGLPLAVELAAARTRTLSLDDIASRLDDRFRLLTEGDRMAQPRQQTLRGVVDWSYDLLFSDEQTVFRRLSVFSGGFGLPAAEVVASGEGIRSEDVLDIVGHLVDKSLVAVVSREGAVRYQLLQTLVEYGLNKLDEAGDEAPSRDRHLDWVASLTASAQPALRGPGQAHCVAVLSAERHNLRAAVDHALAIGRVDAATAMVVEVAYSWLVGGDVNDGRTLIESVLRAPDSADDDHRSSAHAWAAYLTQFVTGMTDEVIEHAERAVALARDSNAQVFGLAAILAALVFGFKARTGDAIELAEEAARRLELDPDPWTQAWVDWTRSGLAMKVGEPADAEAFLRSSVASFEMQGDRTGIAMATLRLSEVAEAHGDYDEAFNLTAAAYDAATESGGRRFTTSTTATRLGNIAAVQGRYDVAAEWHAIGLARGREGSYPGAIAQALSGIAEAAHRRGRLDEAEESHREALAVYTASGSVEGVASASTALGSIANERGEHVLAAELHLRSLRGAVDGNDRRAIALAIEGLAAACVTAGRAHDAGRLLGAAAEIRRTGGGPLLTSLADSRADTAERIRALLGDDAAASSFEEGGVAGEQVVAELLRESVPAS